MNYFKNYTILQNQVKVIYDEKCIGYNKKYAKIAQTHSYLTIDDMSHMTKYSGANNTCCQVRRMRDYFLTQKYD